MLAWKLFIEFITKFSVVIKQKSQKSKHNANDKRMNLFTKKAKMPVAILLRLTRIYCHLFCSLSIGTDSFWFVHLFIAIYSKILFICFSFLFQIGVKEKEKWGRESEKKKRIRIGNIKWLESKKAKKGILTRKELL